MKKYRLIMGSTFSLSNETDADVISDYSPGIWAIKTQKNALKYSRELLGEGHSIEVVSYEPRTHTLGNKFIKELGLKQPLFGEPVQIQAGVVTNGKPSTLGALKKYLQPGVKVRMVNLEFPDRSRETFVKRLQTTSVVLDKNGGDSWLEFKKASDWSFDNLGATIHFINREGKIVPSVRIEYM